MVASAWFAVCLLSGTLGASLVEPPVYIVGGPGEHCQQACIREIGLPCVPYPAAWPQTEAEFAELAVHALDGRKCKSTQRGFFDHYPAVTQGTMQCHWRPVTEEDVGKICRANPAPNDHHFCACGFPAYFAQEFEQDMTKAIEKSDMHRLDDLLGKHDVLEGHHSLGSLETKAVKSGLASYRTWSNVSMNGFARMQAVVSDPEFFRAEILPINDANPTIPGTPPKVGLIFSGGGSRSMTYSVGVLRAFQHFGLMKSVQALTCTSGSCWSVGPFGFAAGSDEELLGPLTKNVGELTMSVLSQEPAKLAKGATTDISIHVFSGLLFGKWGRLWIEACKKAFLAPFGLDDDKYMVSSVEKMNKVIEQNTKLDASDFRPIRTDRPHVFVATGSVLNPAGGGWKMGKQIPLQMGADYSGIFNYPNGTTQKYIYKGPKNTTKEIEIVLGGGLQSTFAFGCRPDPMKDIDEGTILATLENSDEVYAPVELPNQRFTLAEAIGITSVMVATSMAEIPILSALVPTIDMFPIPSRQFPVKQGARKFMLSDGGTLDNLGITTNLQRKVERMAVFFAASGGDGICDQSHFDFCTQFDPDNFEYQGKIGISLSCYFGWGGDGTGGFDYTMNTVFKKEDLGPIACILQQKIAAGQAAIAWMPLEVQPNAWWGIHGGWTVDLLLNVASEVREFESQLPNETRCELKKRNKTRSTFANYPYYKTMGQNAIYNSYDSSLSRAQVNLYAAQAEYSVVSNHKLYKDFIGGVPFNAEFNVVSAAEESPSPPPQDCQEAGAWWKWAAGVGAAGLAAAAIAVPVSLAMNKHKTTTTVTIPPDPCAPAQLWDKQTWKELHLSEAFQHGQASATTWLLPLLCILTFLCCVAVVSNLVHRCRLARERRPYSGMRQDESHQLVQIESEMAYE